MSRRGRVQRFASQPHARGRGRVGEEDAVRYLEAEGYEIVERNATTRVGEVDVIARDGDTLCFIEVKARQTDRYGPAVAGVTPAKQRRLVRSATLWLTENPQGDLPMRFDVLGLDASEDGWRYTLVKNAFEAG